MPSPHIGIREVGSSFFNTGKGQGMKYEVRERILKVQVRSMKYDIRDTMTPELMDSATPLEY